MTKSTLRKAGAVVAAVSLAVTGLAVGVSSANAAGKKIVGIAFDLGGKDSPGFNQLAYIGFQQFAAKHPGWTEKDLQGNNADTDATRTQRLQLLVSAGCNPIVVVGYDYETALKTVSKANPKVHFAIVDDVVPGSNVEGLQFHAEQSSFLVGAIAALTSKSHDVGFIGGVKIPLIQAFEAGFKAGVAKVDPTTKYQVSYISNPPDMSGFNAPDKGKEAALGMFQNGADVVYSAAGSTGQGAHQAASQSGAGHWSIGVDADEALYPVNKSVASFILTSALKNVNVGVNSFLTDVFNNKFTSGTHWFGLNNGGVGYSTTGGHLPASVVSAVNALSKQIVSGAITIPTDPSTVTLPQG
jgi:basic membrane protein A and related proteins